MKTSDLIHIDYEIVCKSLVVAFINCENSNNQDLAFIFNKELIKLFSLLEKFF